MADDTPADEMVEPGLREDFLRTRKSLIDRLENWEDQRAWEEFYRTYWRLVLNFALRSGLARDEAFDVVQETVLAVAKQAKGREFDRRAGTFKSWLFNLVRWRVADAFRRRGRDAAAWQTERRGDDGSARTPTIERVPDAPGAAAADEVWDDEWRQNAAQASLERVRRAVSPKQFQIFDLYVSKGESPEQVGGQLGVSVAQVYLAKHRVGALVRKEVERLERDGF